MTRIIKDPEKITYYQDTYPYKLQALLNPEGYYVILKNRRRNHILLLEENLSDDILCNKSKYVILHLGIVDCAPRLFGYFEDRIIHVFMKVPFLRFFTGLFIKFKSKYRRFFTRYFPKVYTKKKEFKEKYQFILDEIKRAVGPKKVFIVNIAETNEENKFRSYNFEKNIADYNEILKEIVSENKEFCELVDFHSATKQNKNFILDEGIHLSNAGHDLLSRLLYEKIQKADREFK
ncbi:MAG: GDSL-type esterase/lipase family protein [Patescibacteria group bacterium]